MNIQEKLDFFQQLIQCNHNLPLHSFSPDFVFAHSDILEDISANDDQTLILLSLEEPIRKHVENQKREPLFIDEHLGLIWIVAFEYHEDSLCGIHALGPAYYRKKLLSDDKKELDKKTFPSISVQRFFAYLNIFQSSLLISFFSMLLCCITALPAGGLLPMIFNLRKRHLKLPLLLKSI
mgnify:FL=1